VGVSLEFIRVSPANQNSSVLHTHLSAFPEVDDSPGQTARRQVLGLQVRGVISDLSHD
jgi:hypothetical protein